MKLFAILILTVSCAAQTLPPAIPGQRMVIELSTDMTTWTMVMPYNSPRGFLRARPETCSAFVPWINAVDTLTGDDQRILVNGQRNPDCWGASMDLTPLVTNGSNAGVLISPRHVLFVTHYQPPVGTVLQWLSQDNTVVERTLTGMVALENSASYFPDLTVGLLDADVPASISFCRVLDDSTLPANWTGYCVPVVVRNREQRLLVADVQTWASSVTLAAPASAQRQPRFAEMVSGDSGSPVCVVQDGKLVLVALITFGNPGRGANIARQATAINAAMSTLGGIYQLTQITP